MVRLALFCVMVHGLGPNLAVFGPKLDPTFPETVPYFCVSVQGFTPFLRRARQAAGRRGPRN